MLQNYEIPKVRTCTHTTVYYEGENCIVFVLIFTDLRFFKMILVGGS